MGYILSGLYFLLTALGGAALTTLLPSRFQLLERVAYGAFIGVMAAGLLAYLYALAFGFGWTAMWVPLALFVLSAGFAGYRARGGLGREWSELRTAPFSSHLWLLLGVCTRDSSTSGATGRCT